MSEREPTTEMRWTDHRGAEQVRTINQTLDIRDFRETAMYPMLLIAANTHLSVYDLEEYLFLIAEEFPKVKRSSSWIQRRRWMAQAPGTVNPIRRPNADGNDARAMKLIAANPDMSLRRLVTMLRDRRIKRSKDWVRRCRGI